MSARRLDRLKHEAELGDLNAMRQLLIEVRRRQDDDARWSQRIANTARQASAWPLVSEALSGAGEAWLRTSYPVLSSSASSWRFGLRCAQALLPKLWAPWWVQHIDSLKLTADHQDFEHWAPIWVLVLDEDEHLSLSLDALLERAAPLTPHGRIRKRVAWRFLKKSGLVVRHPDRTLSLASQLIALPALPQCAPCADTGSCAQCVGRGTLESGEICPKCAHLEPGTCAACYSPLRSVTKADTRKRPRKNSRQRRKRTTVRRRRKM